LIDREELHLRSTLALIERAALLAFAALSVGGILGLAVGLRVGRSR